MSTSARRLRQEGKQTIQITENRVWSLAGPKLTGSRYHICT